MTEAAIHTYSTSQIPENSTSSQSSPEFHTKKNQNLSGNPTRCIFLFSSTSPEIWSTGASELRQISAVNVKSDISLKTNQLIFFIHILTIQTTGIQQKTNVKFPNPNRIRSPLQPVLGRRIVEALERQQCVEALGISFLSPGADDGWPMGEFGDRDS